MTMIPLQTVTESEMSDKNVKIELGTLWKSIYALQERVTMLQDQFDQIQIELANLQFGMEDDQRDHF